MHVDRPIVPLNASALSEKLAESEHASLPNAGAKRQHQSRSD
jgi:hypothetical protein